MFKNCSNQHRSNPSNSEFGFEFYMESLVLEKLERKKKKKKKADDKWIKMVSRRSRARDADRS